jgi:hypothetical protein
MTLTTVGPLPRIRSPVHDTPLPGTMVYPTPQPHEIDDSHKCTHGRHASSPLQYDLHLDEKLCGSAKRRPVSMARRAKRVERAGTLALALALALVLTDVAPLSLPICVGHHQHIRDLPPARDVSTSTHRHRLIAIDSSPSTHRHRLIAIDSSPSEQVRRDFWRRNKQIRRGRCRYEYSRGGQVPSGVDEAVHGHLVKPVWLLEVLLYLFVDPVDGPAGFQPNDEA